ncbi:uncharacterized protein LOC111874055 isoform X4 [Cryptotermes secundus]|uniref:uncharacterized protein LOC111874055 isoform X4 n=2 Tax=Cryptotermes secundus TaxID=105785 RepID=UPI000CD7C445|nr:uncharacterized protein LOC111874055 isoform X4 [Cryptotermes secundus]
MSVNFGTICRLCMKEAEKLLPLFCQDENLPERVMSLSPGLKLCVGDELPDKVCCECVHQVNASYNFRLQCEISDVSLRQLLLKREDFPPNSKEEVCEIDKVKEEVHETEITVEEQRVGLNSSDDPQRDFFSLGVK